MAGRAAVMAGVERCLDEARGLKGLAFRVKDLRFRVSGLRV